MNRRFLVFVAYACVDSTRTEKMRILGTWNNGTEEKSRFFCFSAQCELHNYHTKLIQKPLKNWTFLGFFVGFSVDYSYVVVMLPIIKYRMVKLALFCGSPECLLFHSLSPISYIPTKLVTIARRCLRLFIFQFELCFSISTHCSICRPPRFPTSQTFSLSHTYTLKRNVIKTN